MARYRAPEDPHLATTGELALQHPFSFGPEIASRLARRGVNPKEAFTICDRTGTFFRASLKQLGPEGGSALPYEQMKRSPEPAVELTLACSVLSRQRMIFVIQKATELGVSRIVPLFTEHSVQPDGLEHEKAFSWPAQILRAAKQCRRSSLPELLAPIALDQFIESSIFRSADKRVLLDDRASPAAHSPSAPARIVLLVGPEGGFSESELLTLSNKCSSWVLGGRILRAETAVIAGLTAIQMRWGDFQFK